MYYSGFHGNITLAKVIKGGMNKKGVGGGGGKFLKKNFDENLKNVG